MPLLFPSNPSYNQSYIYQGQEWVWDGERWVLTFSTVGATGATGIPGSGNLVIYDEGQLISSSFTGINFVGSAVTANVSLGNLVVNISGGLGGSSVTVSNVAPISPDAGALWLDTDSGELYIYYTDNDGSQWIQPVVSNPYNINLLSISSNILPSQTETYNLGSAAYRWRDLYLSGNSLHLGSAVIAASGNALILPAGTQITGGGLLGSTGATGATGLYVTSANITVGNLIITLSDSSTIDAGRVGGSTGATGPQGIPGTAVAAGATGATGPAGSPGGATGATGLTGSPGGATGATGSSGPMGASGLAGARGATGVMGLTGATGATGSLGATGATGIGYVRANINVVTGNLILENSANIVYDVGTVVFQGPEGRGVANVYVDSGNLLVTYTDQIEVNLGPIIGPIGATGPSGGPTGATGATGLTGADGIQGDTGSTGPPGTTGATGPIGATGVPGTPGTPGGATGSIGSTGATGAGRFFYGNTTPVSAAAGDRWFHTDDLTQLIYLDDGTSLQWTEFVAKSNSGANPYLSNLQTPTALNADLLPKTDMFSSLGGANLRFKNLFLGGPVFEKIVNVSNATGVVVHDTTTTATWVHSSISANFTVNFTNVPTTNNQIMNFTLICLQGGVARYPSACQINSASATINWLENTVPSPTANKKEFYTFSILRTSAGSWLVFGSMTTFG